MKISDYQFSRNGLRRIMNIFPPLFFNRISIQDIAPDFRSMRVRVRCSWMNKNFNRSIFGGTIFSAIDPYYPTLYWHVFSRKKMPMEIWLKSAEIRYRRPATSDLSLNFQITDKDISEAIEGLKKEGKFEVWHEVHAIDEAGTICAEAKVLVYLRNYKNLNLNAF